MKLDKDCVRGILLALEEHPEVHANWTESNFASSPYLKGFSNAEILYCIKHLIEGGYLNVKTPGTEFKKIGVNFTIVDSLSWSGHEFLDTIRDDGIWKQTKEVASKTGTTSIPVLLEIGKHLVRQHFGLDV